jgi:hypothetical protein
MPFGTAMADHKEGGAASGRRNCRPLAGFRLEDAMKLDIQSEVDRLAEDRRFTDYDFWRMLRDLDDEIYRADAAGEPIPFEAARWRAILRQARRRRG